MGIVMKKLGTEGGPKGQDKVVMNTNKPAKKKAATKMGGGMMKKKMPMKKGGPMKSVPKKDELPRMKKGGAVKKMGGGAMKKKPMAYDKGGSVTKEQKLAALKEMMKGMGKGGSGAGQSDIGKMLKEIGFPTGKMMGGMMKKKMPMKKGGAVNKRGGGVIRKKPGGAMKPVPEGNKGLAKLPTKVRNKMGYANKGGAMKKTYKMQAGGSCRGGGAATKGTRYSKA